MTSDFRVALGGWSNTIWAGEVHTKGAAFKRKSNCTDQAINAVAELLVRTGQDIYVTAKGGRVYRLSVTEESDGQP